MIFRYIIAVVMVAVSTNLYASIVLEDIRFTELPDNRVEVRGTFSAPPVVPRGYAIEKPARIVLDLAGVNNALQAKRYALGLGNVRSAVILAAKDRTRIILNLSSIASYSTAVEGKDLVVLIDNSVVANKTFTRSQKQELSKNRIVAADVNSIAGIDFRRDDKGAGKVIFDLSNPKIAVDIERSGSDIMMRFPDTLIDDELQRRLDVIDFATPVRFIETSASGQDVVVSIESSGRYDYLAYQADGSYVVNISPLTQADIEEKQSRFKFVGEKLSLNFQDIEVRKVLEIIADFTDLNLVASDTVTGNITLRLENVPWDQALELVLKSKGLDKRQSGNVLLVAPAAEIAERERQELESRKQLQELEPLRTEFIRVRYANATDIFALFDGSGARSTEGGAADPAVSVLSERGTAVVDERTNSIILTDTASNIEAITTLIEKIDVPIRQVMIEARIVIANTDFAEELGFEITGTDTAIAGSGNDNLGGSIATATSTTSAATGTFGVSYLPSDVALNLELTALETSGFAEVVSQPKVITGDKQVAKIESGQQVPFTSNDGTTVTTIFVDAVLSLEVTPQITPDNRVIMELKVNQDSIGDQTTSGPAINVTQLETSVLVGDGETIVLGGIFQQSKSESTSKVPLLGDLPVIGRLFTRTSSIDDKQELLIFITPRILSDSILDK